MPRQLRRCTFALLALVPLFGGFACDQSSPGELPAGLWVAYPESLFGSEGGIRVVHAQSSEERRYGPPATYHSLSWAPDGSRLAGVRLGDAPELVVFSTDSTDALRSVPLESPDTTLYWSPSGLRIAAVSAGSVLLFTTALEIAARFELPADRPANGEVGEGLWSDVGDRFAVPFNGYVLVATPAARWTLIDPADFVREPGETESLTIMDWTEEDRLAVFERSQQEGPARYVLDLGEDPFRLASSSDFPEGAGPLDGLLAEASEAAGGRAVLVGRRGQPGAARWVVAKAGEATGAPMLFVRMGDDFEAVLDDRFAGASAEAIVANISLVVLPEPSER